MKIIVYYADASVIVYYFSNNLKEPIRINWLIWWLIRKLLIGLIRKVSISPHPLFKTQLEMDLSWPTSVFITQQRGHIQKCRFIGHFCLSQTHESDQIITVYPPRPRTNNAIKCPFQKYHGYLITVIAYFNILTRYWSQNKESVYNFNIRLFWQ